MLEKLEPRERLFVIIGGILVIAALVVALGMAVRKARTSLAAEVQEARTGVQRLTELQGQIAGMQAADPLPVETQFVSNITSQLQQYSLNASTFNTLPGQTQQGQTTYGVTMTLRAVRLEDVIKFLHDVEYAQRLPAPVVENIRITRAVSGRELYDVNMTISLTGTPAPQ